MAERLFETRAKNLDIVSFVQDCIGAQDALLKREHFRCSFEAHSASPTVVHIYEPHIMDIVSRLMSNAVKFKLADHTVEVILRSELQEVHIDVLDRGIGMEPDKVAEAIDAFGQIDREKLEQQGGGLGLAIANRYAKINKGRLEFAKRSGGGSRVSLVLPIVKS